MSVNKSELIKSIQSRGNYSTIPNEIWNLPLSKSAKITYIFIISQSDTWNPGTRQIADSTGVSRPTVSKALTELRDHNMITIEEAPNGMRNIYTVLGTSDWMFVGDEQAGKEFDRSDEQAGKEFDRPPVKNLTGTGQEFDRIQEEEKKKEKEKIPSLPFSNLKEEKDFFTCSYDSDLIFPSYKSLGIENWWIENNVTKRHIDKFTILSTKQKLSLYLKDKAEVNRYFSDLERKSSPSIPMTEYILEPQIQIPVHKKQSLDTIYRRWSVNVPEKTSKEERASLLEDLFLAILEEGYKADEISKSLKRDICKKFCPATKPSKMSTDQYESWKDNVENLLEQTLNGVMLKPLPTSSNKIVVDQDLVNTVDLYLTTKLVTKKNPWLFSPHEEDPNFNQEKWDKEVTVARKEMSKKKVRNL